MITEKQWRTFCWDMYQVKRDLGCSWGDISLHGRPVDEINLNDYTIRTKLVGTPTMVYSFKESLHSHTKLKYLYRSVSVETNMERLYKFRRTMND
jgi:hypothetical protein